MASYDYACDKCGSVQEINHPIGKSPKITCSKDRCGGKCSVAFWLKTTPFKLKGSGWSSKGRA